MKYFLPQKTKKGSHVIIGKEGLLVQFSLVLMKSRKVSQRLALMALLVITEEADFQGSKSLTLFWRTEP